MDSLESISFRLKELTETSNEFRRDLDKFQVECEVMKERNKHVDINIAKIGNSLEKLSRDLHTSSEALLKHMYNEEKDRSKLFIALILTLVSIVGTFTWERLYQPPDKTPSITQQSP